MPALEVTDHVINYRPMGIGYGLMPTWGLSSEGTRIGTVWETERGYAGQITGTNAEGTEKNYECPELPFRQAVVDQLGKKAGELGIA
jgi:hypothetical protein